MSNSTDPTTKDFIKLLSQLSNENASHHTVTSLMKYVKVIYRSELEERYSEPMLCIGMYIAAASLVCILAMVADLLHGLRTRKLWFPCKYFTLNAASLTVIAVAMKLPVDLSGSMPGNVDQAAKLGSVAFMCTMMANLLPSLATMTTNELLANMIALVIFIITLVVNICIQLHTGVISYEEEGHLLQAVAKKYNLGSQGIHQHRNKVIATTYVTFLMVLLAIHVCSSLASLRSKQIIDSKYKQKASKEVIQQAKTGSFLTFDELKQHLCKYWIMAGSGSPQFIVACFPTTTASGVISALTFILHTITMSWTVKDMKENKMKDYESDYQYSTLVILLVQFIGVAVGTLAPLSRCFATSSFKVSFKSIPSHMKVFKVELYWTEKLSDWKHGSIRFPFRSAHGSIRLPFCSRQLKSLNDIVFELCILFQERVVLVCKILAVLPSFFMICVLHCLRCFKASLSGDKIKNAEKRQHVFQLKDETETKISEQRQHVLQRQNEMEKKNLDQRQYVLQLENGMVLAERTLKGLSDSLNRVIEKGEKKQLDKLKNLLECSTQGFQGVKKFDMNNHVPSLLWRVEYQHCWSLPIVTLTTVAVTLLNVEKDEVDSLLEGVNEGLEYVTLVEEKLNASDECVSIQKRAEKLWEEVYVSGKWLEDKLQDITNCDDQVNKTASVVEKTRQIVEMLLGKAKDKFNKGVGGRNAGVPNGDSEYKSICANSMYRVTKTIMDEGEESQKELFVVLRSRIADIMAACLINLPQAIAMKCHDNVIEKREACVRAAARLLGETREIISTLQARNDIPRMKLDDMPYIDKWRAS